MKHSLIGSLFFICIQAINGQNVGINTSSPNATLDVYGEMALKSADITADDGVNYSLNLGLNKFSNYKLSGPTANFVLAGMSTGVDGVIVTIHNRSGQSMEIYNEDVNAIDSERISTSTGNTVAIYDNGNVTFQYDGSIGRWQILTTHYSNLDYFGSSGGGFWEADGNNIYNTNTENVAIGFASNPRAKLEVQGVVGNGSTSAIFGGEDSGISLQRNWPTIGFNQFRDGPGGWGKAIASGYGMHMYLDINAGAFAIDMQDSVGKNEDFAMAPKRALTFFKNGFAQIGSNNITDQATLSISGRDNVPSHFNYGSAGNTYIRGGQREYRNIGQLALYRPSKVYINDVSGINSLTNSLQPGGDVILATGGGNVGIGTENTSGYKLAVNGNIRAKELRVNTGWADYVFEKNYVLMNLFDVEKFIDMNGHLPNIPPAEELIKNGVDISMIQEKMMAKIEELTLYLIEAKKEILVMQKKIKDLESKK